MFVLIFSRLSAFRQETISTGASFTSATVNFPEMLFSQKSNQFSKKFLDEQSNASNTNNRIQTELYSTAAEQALDDYVVKYQCLKPLQHVKD